MSIRSGAMARRRLQPALLLCGIRADRNVIVQMLTDPSSGQMEAPNTRQGRNWAVWAAEYWS